MVATPSRLRRRSPSPSASRLSDAAPAALPSASASALLPPRWTVVDGRAYELPPSFFAAHPGGGDLLSLAAGRDASVLFASYHGRPGVARASLR